MDKFIILEYTLRSQIPTELQIPQLGSHLDPYLVDIVNWAAYCPMDTIKKHIRAVTYNQYLLQQQTEDDMKGFPAFIMNKLWDSSRKEDFVTINQIKDLLLSYVFETGDDTVSLMDSQNKPLSNKDLSTLFLNYMKDIFNKNIDYTRYSKRVKVRPMGFTYLMEKGSNVKPNFCQEFKPEFHKNPVTMTEPFYTEQKVLWLEPTFTNIKETQKRINLLKKGVKPVLKEHFPPSISKDEIYEKPLEEISNGFSQKTVVELSSLENENPSSLTASQDEETFETHFNKDLLEDPYVLKVSPSEESFEDQNEPSVLENKTENLDTSILNSFINKGVSSTIIKK